jgi:hypothetical protein
MRRNTCEIVILIDLAPETTSGRGLASLTAFKAPGRCRGGTPRGPSEGL